MLWTKKNSYNEFYNEKKFLRLEKSPPPPPITFLMVRPLADMISYELALSLWIRTCCDWCFSQAMETLYIVFAFSTVRYF